MPAKMSIINKIKETWFTSWFTKVYENIGFINTATGINILGKLDIKHLGTAVLALTKNLTLS